MSDRDELKIIVLAHIRCFFLGDEAGFHNHSQKKEELYIIVRTAEIFRKNKRHFSQPQK
jgi:hypothetical protein